MVQKSGADWWVAVASPPGPRCAKAQLHAWYTVEVLTGGWLWPVFPDQVYAPLTARVGDSLVLSWVNEHNVVVIPARAPAPQLLSNAQVTRLPSGTQ